MKSLFYHSIISYSFILLYYNHYPSILTSSQISLIYLLYNHQISIISTFSYSIHLYELSHYLSILFYLSNHLSFLYYPIISILIIYLFISSYSQILLSFYSIRISKINYHNLNLIINFIIFMNSFLIYSSYQYHSILITLIPVYCIYLSSLIINPTFNSIYFQVADFISILNSLIIDND